MIKLSELEKDKSGIIANVNGDTRFVSRITSIGLTPGCKTILFRSLFFLFRVYCLHAKGWF